MTANRLGPDELDRWMTTHGYSNTTLAEALGVFRSTVVRWRTGEKPTPGMLRLALEALERRPRPEWRKGGRKPKADAA